ncbi:NAD-dependent epimerase/dehydratase family protein [Arenimonas metalli]|uniref:NAD-dependent epimerase/dehydratase family protein n=1 Tax=Arenimonas metalli TaxID=948077 RepID=UPI001B8060F9|nr:NAD(P)-dependent oxidoreductase [Arenimonas metalli]
MTGSGGFLGRRLVARLRANGWDVVELGRANGFDLLSDELPARAGDLVFHLAAETGVPDSWDNPARFHLVNTHGTVRVLDACRRAGASLVFVGAYIYGVPVQLPISEAHPLDPNNPYAFSKWMAEQACEWFARQYSMNVTAVRLFNVYGAGQSDRFIVPRILTQALDASAPDIRLLDLEPRRDYLYVDDAVDALLASESSGGYRLYNVGSGSSHSVQDVVDAVFAAVGSSKPVVATGEKRRNEIPDVRADCSRLHADSGWSPRFSLEAGIRAMVQESPR